jgi:hypothetical protein
MIRHRNYEAWIDPVEQNVDLYRHDASFTLRPALNGESGQFSFESVNYPNYFLRHRNFELHIDEDDNSDLFNADASWIPRKSLTSSDFGFSFEASNYPNHFMRHQSYRMKLHENDNSALFLADASFNFA